MVGDINNTWPGQMQHLKWLHHCSIKIKSLGGKCRMLCIYTVMRALLDDDEMWANVYTDPRHMGRGHQATRHCDNYLEIL